jgi:hypothetical protein
LSHLGHVRRAARPTRAIGTAITRRSPRAAGHLIVIESWEESSAREGVKPFDTGPAPRLGELAPLRGAAAAPLGWATAVASSSIISSGKAKRCTPNRVLQFFTPAFAWRRLIDSRPVSMHQDRLHRRSDTPGDIKSAVQRTSITPRER